MLEHAPAKLNLTLDVLGQTGDGYHSLRSVMQTVEFGDDIFLELTPDGSFSLDPGKPYLPTDESNLALRAAMLFLRDSGRGAAIRVTKRIPVGAGMGGGSCDAAAVLRALQTLTGGEKSETELYNLALQLGSDVPFCLKGGTYLAEGRGEILTPMEPLPPCSVVICKPVFSVSTAELYARVDSRRARTHPDTEGLREAVRRQNLPEAARRCFNVFEDVLPRSHAQTIAEIKSALLDGGALTAAMTGTGSAVFALFSDSAAAEKTHQALRRGYKHCYLTRPYNP